MAVGTAEVALGADFLKQAQALEGIEHKRVFDAVRQFQEDPNHPGLNFHPIQGDPTGRLHTFRASKELRVLVAREGSVYVLLEAGHHDAIYERAERVRFVASAAIGFVGLVELEPGGTASAEPAPRVEHPERGVLDHWTDAELAEAGFDAEDIAKIRACTTLDDLFELDLPDDPILQLVEMVEQTPEQWFAPTLDAEAEAEERIRTAIVEHGALAGISPLFSAEELARLVAAPIEEWMIFLHPDQRAVVTQEYSGAARVRGSAGTGKTVVALHRAAELAHRYRGESTQPVLFTTFIKTLPPVFQQLYARLPAAVPGAVRFVNVDKLAFDVCAEAGERPTIDPRAIEAGFASAWKTVVTDNSPIKKAGLTRGYLRDEVNAVIKGRGNNTLDEYLVVERTGRGTRFGEPLRRQVWQLREAWDAEMHKRGTVDFVDVVRRARDHARRRREPMFRAAIIDEAQDLSLVGLQMIRALVNGRSGTDRSDGLLIVGDGAQRIYAGGFTLRQAGVEVRGRTTVLRTNYRNTGEIICAAMAVAGDAAIDDLGDEYKREEADAEALRAGIRPTVLLCDGFDEELDEVAKRITSLVGTGTISFGDIAVCVATNNLVQSAQAGLQQRGIPVIELTKYEGTPIDKVKVGTHHRVKGLEFKVVFLPGLGATDFPRPQAPGQPDDEYAEVVAMAMSQLFVAMTRARDGLFLLASGEPTTAIALAESYFEVI
jgi:AAA domain/UvrD-like helicase C-terminal domain